MSFLNTILFLGTNEYLPEEDRNSIIVTNGLNFIFAALTFPLIVLFLFINPLISLLALVPFSLYLLGFWLVSRGHYLAARLLLPFTVLFSIFMIAGVVQDLEMYISGYKYLILVSVVIPFMIFKLKELRYTLVFLVITFVLLIFSDKILHYLHSAYSVTIPKHHLLFVDKVVLTEAFLALTAVSFIYRKYVTLYFDKLRGNLRDLIEYKTRMEQKNRELRYQNHLIQKIMDNANDAIILTESADNIIVWNKKAKEIFGYDTEEALGENPHRLLALEEDYEHIEDKINYFKNTGQCDLIGKTVETKARTKNGSIVDIELSLSAISVGNQTYSLAIIRDVTERKRQNRLILQKSTQLERLNKDLTDSMEYARIIQNALFQRDESLRILSAYFRDYFIFFKPLQIVSGDFFYVRQTRKFIIVGVGDCTGHGIPGAFMTLITVSILNELIGPKITLMPNQVLEKLSFHLKQALGRGNNLRDTVELALLFFDKRKNKVYFAGANLPMYFVRNGKLEEIKPDKYPVADVYREHQTFSLKTVELKPQDAIFLSTDGFYSQFGGPDNKKYSRKRFRQLLLSLAEMDFTDASHRIEREFFHWKQANDQTDDVLVIGLKI